MEDRSKIKENPAGRIRVERQFSAGGVVCKGHLWLVAKSNPSKEYPWDVWRLPKGWLDDNNQGKPSGPITRGEKKASERELQECALREVKEEGGIDAKIVKKIGSEKYFLRSKDKTILKFVTFYLMEWERNLSEGFGKETEKVEWLPYEDAYKRLSYKGEKEVLKKAASLL
ncbi:hypothetical protein A3D00_03240 [Candidatus Woesebacteria bacterium RIFCSPHIGHO2_02_FULL_38_9]|uniref:Nudix hydrolase domain-containing protein n=1 Tax=Candidatus Woesebacteria bacterium RIFCSPHIGHO2_01_FULL_39_28 TaxID=1802496 RepID=A0A1F7YK23_9BACT|nr:MAG: hypothetical protein A2627_05685 [Candidatus Woesebacteria bacterium RIFCSPHIGHO2_01_FULL_39_28]OGM31481.1 MAG: hypothetical protein A3D00_03240 [Candidatus Woesebacteria bacterium RIFCSPHIGHO2_02_FULL_38_9]OGM56668.1 MAG: hypothetical protein A3A50_04880 [Candidatus Woesebacteria bacterium RIFCSPLOWO2_01_FULL_38_20]